MTPQRAPGDSVGTRPHGLPRRSAPQNVRSALVERVAQSVTARRRAEARPPPPGFESLRRSAGQNLPGGPQHAHDAGVPRHAHDAGSPRRRSRRAPGRSDSPHPHSWAPPLVAPRRQHLRHRMPPHRVEIGQQLRPARLDIEPRDHGATPLATQGDPGPPGTDRAIGPERSGFGGEIRRISVRVGSPAELSGKWCPASISFTLRCCRSLLHVQLHAEGLVQLSLGRLGGGGRAPTLHITSTELSMHC